MNETNLNRIDILTQAKASWNKKTNDAKEKAGRKYQHFLNKHNLPTISWDNDFESLTKYQQNVIIKGELIRYYDSLPNKDKTYIMRGFGLSTFSSKWYKLPSADKKKLLDYIVK